LALADAWARRGWHVVATVRDSTTTALDDLADHHKGQIEIETVDITFPDQLGALRRRLKGRTFDVLFVNAGIVGRWPDKTVAAVPTEEFVRVMATNALAPMRTIAALEDLVEPAGTIGVMSSGQGSVARNEGGGDEVYRGSMAALNTFMRSYAARHRAERRSLLLMAPGWVRTDLGGPSARLGIDDSIPGVVETIDALRHEPGLHYVDYRGQTVPW
jgi:NAD(P)-dependent dehydrogenase (short-subunit alcohol dehydrogenase family)